MGHFDKLSILRGVGTKDVESIRRIMNALMRRFEAASAPDATQLSQLNADEHTLVSNIFQATRGNGILQEMVLRFASARYGNSSVVIKYAADLDRLAVAAVQDPNSRPASELVMAEAQFNQTIVAGKFEFRQGGDEEYGDIELEESDYDDEDTSVDGAEEPGSGAQPTSSEPSKNAPLRPPGSRCINNGAVDREDCIFGNPDPSKLSIVLGYEIQEPRGSGNWIYGGEVTYRYRYPVDWYNKKSVSDLQKWRNQQFTRQIGPKNEHRAIWLESERDLLVSILEDHLRTQLVGGRWSSVVWKDVGEMYNSFLRGKTQRAGEMTAQRHYNDAKGRDGTSTFRTLAEHRPAPQRTVNALRNQIAHFTGDRVERMIREAKAADDQDTSDDSDNTEQNPAGKKRKGEPRIKPNFKVPYLGKGKGKAIEETDEESNHYLHGISRNPNRNAKLVHHTFRAASNRKGKSKAVQEEHEGEKGFEYDIEFDIEEALKRSRKDRDWKDHDGQYGDSSSIAGPSSSNA